MELFEKFLLETLQHQSLSVRVELVDGEPILVGEGGSLALRTETPLPKDHPLARLEPHLRKLQRVWEVSAAFPLERADSEGRWVAWLAPSEKSMTWSGMEVMLTIAFEPRGTAERRSTATELLLVSRYVLDVPEPAWHARVAAWKAQCTLALAEDEPTPAAFAFEPPVEPGGPDPSWEVFADELDLRPATLALRVAAAAAWAERQFIRVEERYRELYRLPLPRGLCDLAALVKALGMLPRDPPGAWGEGESGWQRGCQWLDEGAQLRPGGITEWFGPGGLERPLFDSEDGKGPLDARLDMRFRSDAPQFVPFAWGEHSDGHHWGLWYDSPHHHPRIGSNWARDSAETGCRQEREMLAFLAEEIEEDLEGIEEDLDDESEYPYRLAHIRTARVVQAHLAALLSHFEKRPPNPLPRCPWPLSLGPTGSPTLAIPPGVGPLETAFLGGQLTSEEQRREALTRARTELGSGRISNALGLGLYLHWRDGDELREEAEALLRDAYLALGWEPFADILRVHVLHRDLRSVGVFKEEPWPPALPTSEEIQRAPVGVQVAWDWLQTREHEQALPQRLEAHERAERLALDWHDPVQRAVATWASDEETVRSLLVQPAKPG